MNKRRSGLLSVFYHQKTHFLLNYLTLSIDDQEITKKLELNMFDNFDRLFWPNVILNCLVIIAQIIDTFTDKNEDKGYASLAVCTINFIHNVLVWAIVRKLRKDLSPRLVFTYLLMNTILMNLFLRDQVP